MRSIMRSVVMAGAAVLLGAVAAPRAGRGGGNDVRTGVHLHRLGKGIW